MPVKVRERGGPLTLTPRSASVIVCAYTLDRWDDLVATVASLRAQTLPPAEILVVADHAPELLARATAAFPDVRVIPSTGPPGLSGARNTGVAAARAPIVAFLDDDATAEAGWLEALVGTFDDVRVLGAGGRIDPVWDTQRPRWFPREFDWVLGCTYAGAAEGRVTTRNMIGANMAFRREVLLAIGGFRSELGHTPAGPLGCEETEACIRASRLRPDGMFMLEPEALVKHRVPRGRTTWEYFRRRCWAEGIAKARVARLAGRRDGLALERRHAFVTLPKAAARELARVLRGDAGGATRAGAMIAGLAVTAGGFAAGTLGGLTVAANGNGSTPATGTGRKASASSVERPDVRPRMRLLVVTPRYLPLVGGVEHHVHQVTARMPADIDVTILTTDTTGELPAEDRVDGVRVLRAPAWPKSKDWRFSRTLYRTVRDGGWDLVHVQCYHTAVAPLAMLGALRARIPYVVTFHGGGHSSRLRTSLRGLQWRVLRPLLARAQRLVCVARFEAPLYSKRLRVPEERFVVIPNGSDLPTLPPGEVPERGGRRVVASIGRLERYKGHHLVIAAMPHLLRRMPDVELRILGHGPYGDELRRLAERLGVGDHVVIGAVPASDRLAMARSLAGFSLVVLMSAFETHPLAIIEALALGRPALVADTSGLSELAEDGLARAVPLDIAPEDLADAIAEELEHPRSVPAVTLPSWDGCAAALVELYRTVLARGERPAGDRVTA